MIDPEIRQIVSHRGETYHITIEPSQEPDTIDGQSDLIISDCPHPTMLARLSIRLAGLPPDALRDIADGIYSWLDRYNARN